MEYRIIDTHCHPQFPQFDVDRDAVVRRSLDAGIGMVCVGTDIHTSRQAIELAEKYEGIYASVGLHPNDNLTEKYNQSDYEMIAQHPKVVAIGEIGLDYFRTTDEQLKRTQRDRFMEQLELAKKTDKPVIIHSRDSHDDMVEILRSYRRSIKGVIHSFNGTVVQARSYVDEGFMIGLNGIATFSESYREMIQSIPLDLLLLETDSPYLAPAPYRGKRNEPVYIESAGKYIAHIRGVDEAEVYASTTTNAIKLFSMSH